MRNLDIVLIGAFAMLVMAILVSMFILSFPEKHFIADGDYNFYSKGWHDSNLSDINSETNDFNLQRKVLGIYAASSDFNYSGIGINTHTDSNLLIVGNNSESIIVIQNFGYDWNITNKKVYLYSNDKNELCFVYDGNNWNECESG